MTEALKGFIQIEPKPQKRHRTSGRRRYDPSLPDKQTFLDMCVIIVGRPENPPEGDVVLHAKFVCRVKSGRRPDLDNLIKFVMDALNGAYWQDDSQICALIATREFTKDNDKVGTHLEIQYPEPQN